jgi:hypothetical protein
MEGLVDLTLFLFYATVHTSLNNNALTLVKASGRPATTSSNRSFTQKSLETPLEIERFFLDTPRRNRTGSPGFRPLPFSSTPFSSNKQ